MIVTIDRVLSGEQRWHVEHGDSLAVLKSMPDSCVDAIVTDPPAGIGFMGKSFDHNRGGRDKWIAWLSSILAECYRVTKPGGRMLCWSIPRTMHWTGMAIEDSGWFVENTIAHINGAGFPKGKTQLKPSFEGWWLARKPAKHVLPLNIDECRIAPGTSVSGGGNNFDAWRSGEGRDDRPQTHGERSDGHTNGRWPANLAFTHAAGCNGSCVAGCPVAELDRQSGHLHGAGTTRAGSTAFFGKLGRYAEQEQRPVADKGGGASRFFHTFQVDPDDIDTAMFIYQAKASRADREAGCDSLDKREAEWRQNGRVKDRTWIDRKDGKGPVEVNASLQPRGNHHPTVKGTPLMRHLVKLITPPGGIVLDAFCGSGSTGRGAVLEGCRFIGIEQSDTEAEPYVTIARRRIADAESKAITASGEASPQDGQAPLPL